MTGNIEEFLKADAHKELLRFSTAGSVDDGKSTLIGRLLHDSKQIYEDQLASVKNASGKINNELEIDFALVTDGLKAEREQGITIDVAYRYFSTPKRKFIIADTPGHEQYTRNMATGASTANLALILIDARNGVLTQSKRHAFISSLLGIPHIVVAVNKMDLMNYKSEVFEKIKQDFSSFASKLKIPDLRFIPVSALHGDNVVESGSKNMPWYRGPSLMELLENVYIGSDRNLIDLRFPVQYVLRPSLDFRGYSGKIASGVVRKGDEVLILPSMKKTKVESIITYDGELDEAASSESVTLTLQDEIDISRGDMIVHKNNIPHIGKHFEGMVVWMDENPLDPNGSYYIKHSTNLVPVRVDELRYRINVNTTHKEPCVELKLNEIGRVVFSSSKNIFFDPYDRNKATGSFIIIDRITNNTAGAGMILDREPTETLPKNIKPEKTAETFELPDYSEVSLEEKSARYGQKPVTVWLTGFVASGKREIASKLEKKLFDSGHACIILDAKTIRNRMNKELDFTESGRAENLRRVAEMSRILNSNGLISICAFVSPSENIRKQVAEIIGEKNFIEIFVDSSKERCRKRDKTGIYERAEKEKLDYFTGVSAPYDRPVNPDILLDMNSISIDEAAEKIFKELVDKKIIKEKNGL